MLYICLKETDSVQRLTILSITIKGGHMKKEVLQWASTLPIAEQLELIRQASVINSQLSSDLARLASSNQQGQNPPIPKQVTRCN